MPVGECKPVLLMCHLTAVILQTCNVSKTKNCKAWIKLCWLVSACGQKPSIADFIQLLKHHLHAGELGQLKANNACNWRQLKLQNLSSTALNKHPSICALTSAALKSGQHDSTAK